MSDLRRSAVYSAEDQWSALLDRGGRVDFHGSALFLREQLRFGDLAAMQAYADQVLALPGVQARFAPAAVTVRARRGATKAHYEPDTATIAIPMSVGWAARESVLLHELAHHVDFSAAAPHGLAFTSAMCFLVSAAISPEAALLLRAGYDAVSVPVTALGAAPVSVPASDAS